MQKYPGSDEAAVATYLPRCRECGRQGQYHRRRALSQAGSRRRQCGPTPLSPTLSGRYIFRRSGRSAEAEKLARDIVAKPTTLVSKDQARLTLARILASPSRTRPASSWNRCGPPGAASRVAIQAMADLGTREVSAEAAAFTGSFGFRYTPFGGGAIRSRRIPIATSFSAIATASCTRGLSAPGRQDAGLHAGLSDHFRNRLTHTIEVSQIARTRGRRTGPG